MPRVAFQRPPIGRCRRTWPTRSASPPVFPVAMRVPLDLRDAAAVRAADARISGYEAHRLKLWLATVAAAERAGGGSLAPRAAAWLASHRKSLVDPRAAVDAGRGCRRGLRHPRGVDGPSRGRARGGARRLVSEDAVRDRLPAARDRASSRPTSICSRCRARRTRQPCLPPLPPRHRAWTSALPATICRRTRRLPPGPTPARHRSLGTRVTAVVPRGSSDAVEAALRRAAPRCHASDRRRRCHRRRASSLPPRRRRPAVSPQVSHRLLFENHTFGTYLFYRSASTTPLESGSTCRSKARR